MSTPRLLVVEDVAPIRANLADRLIRDGYGVTTVESAEEALELLARVPFDLVLLDLGLPGMSGLELLEALPERGLRTTVLVLSGLPDRQTHIRALDLGAMDVLEKPPLPGILEAHVRALLRQSHPGSRQLTLHDDRVGATIDLVRRHVLRPGQEAVDLSQAEVRLLSRLAQDLGETVPSRGLYRDALGYTSRAESRALVTAMGRLRAKIELDPANPRHLLTVRGVGYRLVVGP